MNSLIETLDRLGAEVLPVAWQMLWQSSLLIIAVAAVDLALRRKLRASVRYALWLVVLIKLISPPALALPTGLAWWLRPSEAPPQQITVQPRNIVVTYSDTPVPMFAPITQEEFVPPPPRLSTEGWAFVLAAATSAALLAWLSFRWIQVSRIVRRATETDETLRALLRDVCAQVLHPGSAVILTASCGNSGTRRQDDGAPRRRVRLLLTKEKMSPAVCGLLRPVILLPESLADNLPDTQMRAVLIHELVHLKRGDVWVNCLQALLQIVYWWHPLLWFANARIRRVREEAVDDAVMLALRDDASTYAPTLLEVAKLAFHRPLASLGLVGILESRSALRQRVERLIDFKSPRRAGLSFVSILSIAAFTAVAVPMGEAPPKQSEAKSQITLANNQLSKSPPDIIVAKSNVPTVRIDSPIQLAKNSVTPATNPTGTTAEKSPLNGILAFDKELKEATVNAGEVEAQFTFNLTNVSSSAVTITNILTSCGCTIAKMPASPWVLAPGATGEIPVTMNVAGKSGELTKTITVNSDKGTKTLTVKATIMASPPIQLAQNSVATTTQRSPLDGVLAFDKELKEATVNSRILAFNKDYEVKFKFDFTNVASFDVIISNITTSCGCTVAKMPMSPWLLEPGAHGEIPVTMNVAGKSGEVTKTVSVISDRGTKVLTVKATIQPQAKHETNSFGAPSGTNAAILVQDGKLLFELGKFDEAEAKLSAALELDPKNPAANYYLLSVGLARERKNAPDSETDRNHIRTSINRQTIMKKLDQIRFDQVSFDHLPLSEVVRFLRQQVMQRDPDQVGINFLVNQPDASTPAATIDPSTGLPGAPVAPTADQRDIKSIPVSINPPLTNPRLADALEAIVKGASQSIKYSILDYGIVFSLRGPEAPQLMSRQFKVDPNTFIQAIERETGMDLSKSLQTASTIVPRVSPVGNRFVTTTNPMSEVMSSVITFFHSRGVDLSPPKSIFYGDREGRLWVRATKEDLDIIEQVIQTLNVAPPQAKREANSFGAPSATATGGPSINLKITWVEIEENQTSGFDWYLGELKLDQAAARPGPLAGSPLITSPVTRTTKDSDFPRVNGILAEPQFQIILKALTQRKGLSAPAHSEATFPSGGSARMEVGEVLPIMTGINPQALNPPGVPHGTNGADPLFQITMVHTGPIFDVTGQIGGDGQSIDMDLTATITEFSGYAKPTNSASVYVDGKKNKVPIPRPIYEQRQISTHLTVWDGQAIVLGGLISKAAVTTGRKSVAKNLLVFATPTLVDAGGNRIRAEEQPAAKGGNVFPGNH